MTPFTMHVRIESAAFEPGTVQLAELRGREAISRLFEYELRLVSLEGAIDEDALLTSPASLVFEIQDPELNELVEIRRLSGIICSLRDRSLGTTAHREYVVTLVPRAWQATLTSTSDVVMDSSVPEILQKKLEEGAGLLAGPDVEMRLSTAYKPREFVVQYKETNLDFVCRLAEDLGICFFFEEVNGRDVMVFADDNAAFKPSVPEATPFRPSGERSEIFELEARRQLVPKSFVARDYNYRNPAMDVLGEAQAPVLGGGKIDEYGPHAKTSEEATFYAKVRAEEATARSFTFEGKSALPGLRAGSVLLVEEHPRGDLELVVTEVTHQLAQAVFGEAAGKERAYSNTFRAIPKRAAYRPPRLTPKPIVHGVVTGIVESESSTKLGAVDDQGRYRVAFMYDSVTGRGDGKASRPLRMAQPSAAADRGFHIPLKPGTEVIITCVNGDPDRPIIAGAVPNPQTPSPVSAANAEKSMWKTNVNTLAIDDDQPRCKLSVNGEDHVFQVGQPNAPEFGIVTTSIGNVSTMTEGISTSVSSTLTAYQDYKTAISAKDIVNVAGVPSPWSAAKKLDAIIAGTIGFMKGLSSTVGSIQKYWIDDAEADKAAADAKLLEAKKNAVNALKLDAKPQKKKNADGTVRDETEDEARDRAVANLATSAPSFDPTPRPKGPPPLLMETDAEGLERAFSATNEAGVTVDVEPRMRLDDNLQWRKETSDEASRRALAEPGAHVNNIQSAYEAADKAAKDLQGYKDWWEKTPLNVETGPLGEAIKDLEKIVAAVKAGEKLFSAFSNITQKVTQKAEFIYMAAAQKHSALVTKRSGERRVTDPGSFGSHFNIQGATDSVGLQGMKNAFVYGQKHAGVFSPAETAILGGKQLHLKSRLLVEMAAEDVLVSGKKTVDVHSTGTVKIVAHTGDKEVAVPGGHTMYLHSKEGILLDSVDKDIEAKAKMNVKVHALDQNVEIVAKQMFKVKAEDKDIDMCSGKGKVEIQATDGAASLRAKKKVLIESMDSDLTVLASKGNGTVKTAKELNLESKSGRWKTSGNLDIKVKKLIVNGTKVELG